MFNKHSIAGLILAGGRSSRMGGEDKSWLLYHDKPMIKHVLERIAPQVNQVIISANENIHQYRGLGCSVVEDERANNQGPLAGIAAALDTCEEQWLLVAACDAPNIPDDLAVRLWAALEASKNEVCVAYPHDGKQTQHLFMLLHKSCLTSLKSSLQKNQYSVMQWIRVQSSIEVDFSDCPGAFININTPLDLNR